MATRSPGAQRTVRVEATPGLLLRCINRVEPSTNPTGTFYAPPGIVSPVGEYPEYNGTWYCSGLICDEDYLVTQLSGRSHPSGAFLECSGDIIQLADADAKLGIDPPPALYRKTWVDYDGPLEVYDEMWFGEANWRRSFKFDGIAVSTESSGSVYTDEPLAWTFKVHEGDDYTCCDGGSSTRSQGFCGFVSVSPACDEYPRERGCLDELFEDNYGNSYRYSVVNTNVGKNKSAICPRGSHIQITTQHPSRYPISEGGACYFVKSKCSKFFEIFCKTKGETLEYSITSQSNWEPGFFSAHTSTATKYSMPPLGEVSGKWRISVTNSLLGCINEQGLSMPSRAVIVNADEAKEVSCIRVPTYHELPPEYEGCALIGQQLSVKNPYVLPNAGKYFRLLEGEYEVECGHNASMVAYGLDTNSMFRMEEEDGGNIVSAQGWYAHRVEGNVTSFQETDASGSLIEPEFPYGWGSSKCYDLLKPRPLADGTYGSDGIRNLQTGHHQYSFIGTVLLALWFLCW